MRCLACLKFLQCLGFLRLPISRVPAMSALSKVRWLQCLGCLLVVLGAHAMYTMSWFSQVPAVSTVADTLCN